MAVKTSEIIVSHRSLENVFRAQESAASGAELATVAADDLEKARFEEDMEQAQIELQHLDKNPDVLVAPDHRPAALLQSFAAENAAQGAGRLERVTPGGYEAQFDEHDVAWAGSLFTWWRRWLDKHPWITPPAAAAPLPGQVRLGLLGDWGTGLYGAPRCAASLRAASHPDDTIIHLGDVYYSGTPREVEERFLAFWPKVVGVTSRACNSNHEMYTGGNAYFRHTLPAFGQQASAFALQNDHWLFVGLDSAYEGSDVHGGRVSAEQLAWLRGLVDAAGTRKVVLFSHHQPYSLYEGQGRRLAEDLASVLEAGRIHAWYWGHEHRCVLYDPHPTWGLHGRCVGHSGYPYFRDHFPGGTPSRPNPDGSVWRTLPAGKGAPRGMVLDGPNPYVEGHVVEYGPNGYMTVEFAGPDANERVHAPDGTILLEQPLP
jgi:3',5'-cyclic AMP phosphodiesterase CpdA